MSKNYECKVCLRPYDLTTCEPRQLVSCFHLLCNSCVDSIETNKCPFCNAHFTSSIPCTDLIEKLDPTRTASTKKVDEMKSKLRELITQSESLLNELEQEKDRAVTEAKTKLDVVKSQIQSRTNELVKEIYNSRGVLTEESRKIENDVKKKLSDDLVNNKKLVDKKLTDAKKALQKNEIKTEDQCNKFLNGLNEKKQQLNDKLQEQQRQQQLNQEYYFKPNELIQIPSDFIGEIAEVVRRSDIYPDVPYDIMDELEEDDGTPTTNDVDLRNFKSKAARKGTKIQQQQANAHLENGVRLSNLGMVDEALLEYERALEIEPDFYDANELRGHLLLLTDCPREAIKHFNKCIQIDSKLKSGYEGKSICMIKLQKWQEGLETCLKLLEIVPDNHVCRFNLGRCYLNLKKYNQAIEALDEAIKIDPTAECYETKGLASLFAKRSDEAIKAFKQAKRIDPQANTYDGHLANAYLDAQKYHECIDLIEEILERSSNHESTRDLYVLKAEALYELKNLTEAISAIKVGLRENPHDHVLEHLLEKYNKEARFKQNKK